VLAIFGVHNSQTGQYDDVSPNLGGILPNDFDEPDANWGKNNIYDNGNFDNGYLALVNTAAHPIYAKYNYWGTDDPGSVISCPGVGGFVHFRPSADIPFERQNVPVDIVDDTTWSGNKTIAGEVAVMPGVTLTINPTVTVNFAANSGAKLMVEGTLNADGVTFKSSAGSPTYRDWEGILLRGDLSLLRNCIIKDAEYAVVCEGADDIVIENCEISHCYSGIDVEYSTNVTFNDNDVHTTVSHAIDCRYSSDLTIEENDLISNHNSGISINQCITEVLVDNNVAYNSWAGIQLSDSWSTINGNELHDNTLGILLWSGYCDVNSTKIERNETGIGIYGDCFLNIQGDGDFTSIVNSNFEVGILCRSNSQPTIVNTHITANGDGSDGSGGVVIEDSAQPNLGNLDNTSTDDDGGNTFDGNSPYDIANNTSNVIYAQGNYWNSVSQADIDARIYDDGETQGEQTPSGKVEFWPVLAPEEGKVDVFYGDVYRDRRISSYDASLVARYIVGLEELDPDQQVRAEVSGDERISSYDASLIAQYRAGLIDHFHIEDIPAAPSDKRDGNTYVVRIGGERIADGFANGGKIQLPITVDDATGVFSGEFEIHYDASLIRGVRMVKGDLISEEGFLSSDEHFQFNILSGIIKFAFAGIKMLQGGGTIAVVECQLLPKAFQADKTPILLSDGQFNESGKMVMVDGSIKLRPPKADLLENFPNPFNPETWIPYQLSEPAQVVIKIYNVRGQLVRTLDLGQKEAGYYMTKARASHWDGRNTQGERVASGVYFYTIKADKFVATKRFVMLK